MTVTSVTTSIPDLNILWTADFNAPVAQVWKLWSNPRMLERWMGPRIYPASVETFDLKTGGGITYVLTGPNGGKIGGTWPFTAVDPPTSLEYVNGDVNSAESMPITTWVMTLFEQSSGTHMELSSHFASKDQMDRVIAMGTEEGHTITVGQMDALLTESGDRK